MPNRLAREKSPYLLQHAHNPVDWYPWGDEAFARARTADLPLFLSVGYSTCHWCHVMEHESFEHEAVAAVLNRDYVPVKVDREERPDVDRLYMAFVQATTGSGGWPMSVWLTPDLKPFYGGTYFPPDSRYGRPGFLDVLTEISRVWREERGRVLLAADRLVESLASLARPGGATTVPDAPALERAVAAFAGAYDARRGGFGQAPKFPRPSELLFLLRESARTGATAPRDMVVQTLEAMASGGMRDHIGGGFHRYSVDGDWRVPHFEKMLYDQAQLVLAYLEASQATGDDALARVADDTLAYVARDLTDPGGAFYSAEDADSVPPAQAATPGARKTEGAFYLWATDEVDRIVGEDAALVRTRFGMLPEGNAPFDPHNEFGSGNIPYLARTVADLSRTFSLDEDVVAARLERSRAALFAARETRPRPHLDDKILTSWNGLMIAAFARAGRVLGRPAHVAAARRAAEFLRARLWQPDSRTQLRRYRDGEAAIAGYADDYANLIWGLLELFQADGDPAWLAWASDLQHRQDELFWDENGGGWFSTSGADPSLLLRMKEDYDGAEPSASAVGALNLLVLAHLTGDARWTARLERVFAASGERAATVGRSIPMMLTALSAWHAGTQQLVIVGPRAEAATQRLLHVAAKPYAPFLVVVPVEPGPRQDALAALSPALAAMRMVDAKPTAFLCHDFACQAPVTEPDALRGMIEGR